MKQVDRTKVCWNCEADVSYEATYCPFCGTDLLTSSSEPPPPPKESQQFTQQSLEESLASLYKPPYSARNRQGLGIPDEREESSFREAHPPKEDPLFQSYESVQQPQEVVEEKVIEEKVEEEETARGNVWPLLLLSIGAHLFLLGMLILFCSKEGRTVLEWNSRYWFFYCLLSAPLLFLGIRQLKTQSSS